MNVAAAIRERALTLCEIAQSAERALRALVTPEDLSAAQLFDYRDQLAAACQVIPVRDYLLSMVGEAEDAEGKAMAEALVLVYKEASPKEQPLVAATAAYLFYAFDIEHTIMLWLLDQAGDLSMAKLLRSGIDMEAPHFLLRKSMRWAKPLVLADLKRGWPETLDIKEESQVH